MLTPLVDRPRRYLAERSLAPELQIGTVERTLVLIELCKNIETTQADSHRHRSAWKSFASHCEPKGAILSCGAHLCASNLRSRTP